MIPLLRVAPLCLAAAFFANCSPSSGPSSAPSPSPVPLTDESAVESKEQLELAFVANSASDFWVLARKGCELAEREVEDVKVDFLVASEGTPAEQKRIVDDLLARGIDGLAISPVDPVSQTHFINETAKKTLVFTQDNDAQVSDRVCYIGTDNHDAGKRVGELLKQALPEGGKAMIFLGKIDAQNSKDRVSGIKEAIKDTKIRILDVLPDDTDRFLAKANVIHTLVNHPDVAALVGLWSYNGPAILSSVKDAGKVGQVKIVCFDEEDETLAGVKEGAIFGTVVQQPFEFGRLAIVCMAKYLRGDKSVVPESKEIIVPTLVVRQENVDEFIMKINELRHSLTSAIN